MAHHYSIEQLVHYRCAYCEGVRAEQIARGIPKEAARPCW